MDVNKCCALTNIPWEEEEVIDEPKPPHQVKFAQVLVAILLLLSYGPVSELADMLEAQNGPASSTLEAIGFGVGGMIPFLFIGTVLVKFTWNYFVTAMFGVAKMNLGQAIVFLAILMTYMSLI